MDWQVFSRKTVLVKFIRSDNRIFIIDGTDWHLTSLKGLDFPDVDIYTEKKAVGNGSVVTGKRINDRTVTVGAKSLNIARNEIMRAQAEAFFNPLYNYRCYYTYQGTAKWIEADLEAFSCPQENVYKPIKLTVQMYSKNPFLRSIDEFGKDIASISPMFGFPYIQTRHIAIKASVFNFAKEVLIDNDGSVETYCRAVIKASDEVVNPKLLKDGKYLRILDVMQNGDIYEVDFANYTVYKNGENAITKVDKLSSFTQMQLQVGKNKVSFDADNGDNNMSVTLYFNKLYMGM